VFLGTLLLAGPVTCDATEPQVLLISVLQTDDAEYARGLLANTSAIEADHQTTVRSYGTDSLRQPEYIQQVRVIESQVAHISTVYRSPEVRLLWAKDGGSRIVPNVDLVTQESMSGFYVQAELQGNEVLLKLDVYSGKSKSERTGSGLNQNMRTTVYGHVGDWLDAGGSLLLGAEPAGNRVYTLQQVKEGQKRLLVKVELVH